MGYKRELIVDREKLRAAAFLLFQITVNFTTGTRVSEHYSVDNLHTFSVSQTSQLRNSSMYVSTIAPFMHVELLNVILRTLRRAL